MYGKFFASTFTGSMFGAGSDVFALWGYVIATSVNGVVEVNPAFVAAVLGATPERVSHALDILCSPDARSRSKAEQGRRMIHEGAYQYHVVNHTQYRAIRNEEDRRAYNRDAKRRERARKSVSNGLSMTVNESQSCQPIQKQSTEYRVQNVQILASSKPDAGKRPPKPATSNQPIKALLAEHERLFVARYGEKPGPYGGKDAKLAQSVIASHGLERAQALLGLFFAADDPFFATAGHAFPAFVACLSKVIALGASPYPNDPPSDERLYDCRHCGGFHQGADTSVCSKDRGPVYRCQTCRQPHQGLDSTVCQRTEAA